MKNYIVITHEIGARNMDTPINFDEFIVQMARKGYDARDNTELHARLVRSFGDAFVHNYHPNTGFSTQPDAHYTMTSEAYYRYLDYIELREARVEANRAKRDAHKAQKTANAALEIAIVVGILQIFIALLAWQLPRT